jgi:hypothetical protein
MDYGKRVAVEKNIDDTMICPARYDDGKEVLYLLVIHLLLRHLSFSIHSNVLFDESGNFIVYATIAGIKIVNIGERL